MHVSDKSQELSTGLRLKTFMHLTSHNTKKAKMHEEKKKFKSNYILYSAVMQPLLVS